MLDLKKLIEEAMSLVADRHALSLYSNGDFVVSGEVPPVVVSADKRSSSAVSITGRGQTLEDALTAFINRAAAKEGE